MHTASISRVEEQISCPEMEAADSFETFQLPNRLNDVISQKTVILIPFSILFAQYMLA
jgi:hypothetical protein